MWPKKKVPEHTCELGCGARAYGFFIRTDLTSGAPDPNSEKFYVCKVHFKLFAKPSPSTPQVYVGIKLSWRLR